MAISAKKMKVWVASISNKPGALGEQLAPLTGAGAELSFVLARRENKRSGVVFLAGLKGARQLRAAREAGFEQSTSIHALRVEGADRAGLGQDISAALGEAGINIRGLSAGVIDAKFVLHLALDSAEDAAKAGRIIRKL